MLLLYVTICCDETVTLWKICLKMKQFDLLHENKFSADLGHRLVKKGGQIELSAKVKPKHPNRPHGGGLQYSSYTPLQLFQE